MFSGKPEPSIKWFKEGHDITQNADFEITYKNGRVALKIPEAFEEDAGHYECRAANKAGTAKSNAELVVKGRLFALRAHLIFCTDLQEWSNFGGLVVVYAGRS